MSQSGKNLDIFGRGERGPRYRLIACEVMYRECCFAAAVSPRAIDLHFLTQGLHDLQNTSMAARIQAEIDSLPEHRYDAVLLGYALCNNGIVGVKARTAPLVVPRAHDCISLFMGSRHAYQDHFDHNPGTYYLTTGWVERDKDNLEDTMGEDNVLRKMGLDRTYEEYVATYGEEMARMIMGTVGGLHNYKKMTHIDMGLAPATEERVQHAAQAESAKRSWDFERLAGRMDLFLDLAAGDWDEERFLVVQPGQTIQPAYSERIIQAV